MELLPIKGNTYYIKNPTNIGVYKVNEEDVWLIDTGNDKDAGKKILNLLAEENLHVIGIVNTHSHADHIGGNKVIQDKCLCPIYNYGIEKNFTENPILEPSLLYGARPFKELQNKFLCAPKSICKEKEIPFEIFSLKGHSIDLIGYKTKDDVYFIGDALFSEETITKYHLFYLFDVKEYLNSLQILKTLKGIWVPSHGIVTSSISSLIHLNEQKIEEICKRILTLLKDGKTHEELVQALFKEYSLTMNLNQFYLIGSTVKAYLTYLLEEKKITYDFIDNKMIWKCL